MRDSMQTLIQNAVVLQPFGRKLGLRCEEIERDHVCVRLPFAADLATIGDTVHGGAIASLVDVAATAAAWASPELPEQARGTTVGFSIHFLSAGRGCDLLAEAEVIRRGGSICVIDVHVRDTTDQLVARATVTYKLSTGR